MQNQFQLNEQDGIIYITFQGDQTYNTVNELESYMQEAAKKLQELGRPILVLGDTTGMTHQDSGSRKAGSEMMSHINLSKYALVITSTYLRVISKLIAKATGLEKKVKHFSNREDAITWLKS